MVFTVLFRHGTARSVSVVDVLPGAVIAALGWQGLQQFGTIYVTRVIARSRDVTGVFAVVLGLIAFLYLAAVLLVVWPEINAVRKDKLYPRALLTEFTDNVQLLPGDVAAYTRYAKAQRNKGFQVIETAFPNPSTTRTRPPRTSELAPPHAPAQSQPDQSQPDQSQPGQSQPDQSQTS